MERLVIDFHDKNKVETIKKEPKEEWTDASNQEGILVKEEIKEEIDIKWHEVGNINDADLGHEALGRESKTNLNAEIKWFKCEKCEYKAKRKASLKLHVTNKHVNEDKTKRFRCVKCGFRAKEKKSVEQHMINRHPAEGEVKRFKCEICDFSTNQKKYLREHVIARHLSEDYIKWFHCEKCDHKSKRKSDFKKHMLTRHVTKPRPANKVTVFRTILPKL